MFKNVALACLLGFAGMTAHAAIVVTEVDAAGSAAASGYGADWFEIYNNGPSAVSLAGWRVDDSSSLFTSAVAIRGVSSIAAGQVIILAEGASTNANDATIQASFITSWFNGVAPAGFTMGFYGGSGVGLSQTADAVNLFDASGVLQARVDFGATSFGATLDNSIGSNNVTLLQTSVVGVNGAFLAASLAEVGSPGVQPIPEPSEIAIMLAGLGMASVMSRRRRRAL